MKNFSPAFLFFFLVSLFANAQLELVKDINQLTSVASSNPNNLTEVNGSLYFSASDATHGTELWKSDGTAEGTVLLKDISVGTSSSGLAQFIALNGVLYFSANDGVTGQELWKSDGTAEGTVIVKDITSGTNGTVLTQFAIFNGALYFSANDGVVGAELWKTDGTADGTVLVKDIFTGPNGSSPSGLKVFNGTLYFQANNGVNGFELWRADGTAEGTVLVKDLNIGSLSSNPGSLTVSNGMLYFTANDGVVGQELWKTDGSPEGTALVKDIRSGTAGSFPQQLTDFNGVLYFNVNDGVSGPELWKSDGTTLGTMMLKDIFPGTSGSSPSQFTVFNGALYFSANDGVNGSEIWRTDGTTAGTNILKDIYNGPFSSSPGQFKVFNETLYFNAGDALAGSELFKTDGTTVGTVMVKDISITASNPTQLTIFNGAIYFRADNGINGVELWKSNGTSDGTELVKDIFIATNSSNPSQFTTSNGIIYFTASDGVNGLEVWKTNGTTEGTVLLKDISVGVSGSNPTLLAAVNGVVYFSANDGIYGVELWKTDGTAEGTVLVKDIFSGPSGSNLFQSTLSNGVLYFVANDNVTGSELWKTDGTAEGTVLVKDIRSGINGANPQQLTAFNGAVYFRADDGIYGVELWKTDGTAEGTVLVKDIRSGINGASPQQLTVLNGTLYFVASDNINGQELWKTDGTAEGTVLVKDIAAGTNSSFPQGVTAFNGTLYFNATDGVTGQELWKSDGTAEGTVLVKDIFVGPNGGGPFQVAGYNGMIFFTANDGITGNELWKSDGTTAGTMLVMDIVSGSGSGSPSNFKVFGNAVYFSSGGNLWKTQGSACNTVMVATGTFNSFTALGQALYGSSLNSLTGTELFKYNIENDPVTNCAPTVQASNIIVSNTLSDQATISFTKGNGTHRAVLMKDGFGDREECAIGVYFLIGNSDFSSSSRICPLGRPYNLVYADTGNVVHVTGLLPGHTYKVMVLEYNRDTNLDYLLVAGAPVDTVSTIVAPNVYVTTPANGALNQKTKLSLTAKSVTGATTYTIEISPNSNFSSNVISKSGGRTLAFDSLSYGTTYFTRVKTNLRPDYGTTTTFTTIGAEQLAYIITPKNLAINQKIALNVTSNIVPLATQYTIELATLTGDTIVQTGGRTQMFDSLKYGTTYYARVKTEFTENWGATRSFTTLDATSISYVITPANAAVNQKISLNVTANLVLNATEYTIELNTLGNFSGASIIQTGGRTQLFSGLNYNTTYYSRVKTEFTESWGATRTFKTINADDLSYVYSPANNAVNASTSLNVTSNTVPNATLYTIQLSEFLDFRTINFEKSGTSRTQAFTGLKYNTLYYNRVRTNLSTPDNCPANCDAIGALCYANAEGDPDLIAQCQIQYLECKAACPVNVGWGAVRSFKTRTAESLAYVTSPANGAIDRKTILSITSNTVPGASSYTIQLSVDSVFSSIASEVTGPTRTLAFSGLNGGTKYYNRVTTNAPGTVGYGQVRSFKTIGVPPAARLSSPGDQVVTEELQVETAELKEFEVHVYPNPFHEKLIFQIEARVAQQATVTLMDVNGKAVHESIEQTNKTVEIEKPLAVGVYLLRVTAGTQYKMIRVVKSE